MGQKGAAVVVNCAGSQLLSQGVVGRSRSQANMGKVDDIRRLFPEKVEQFGQLNILVNTMRVLALLLR